MKGSQSLLAADQAFPQLPQQSSPNQALTQLSYSDLKGKELTKSFEDSTSVSTESPSAVLKPGHKHNYSTKPIHVSHSKDHSSHSDKTSSSTQKCAIDKYFLVNCLSVPNHLAKMDLLTVRSVERQTTKTKAAEDARQMQVNVIEECKKSGKSPPHYSLLELIGKGSFGRVYKGWDTGSGRLVAVKIIDIDEGDTLNPRLADTYSDFMKEVNALKVLSNTKAKNINHVIEALPVGKAMWMITEYCAGGSISTLMRPTPRGLKERFIIIILREVAEAVKYVHAAGIIHRDLKCANVLITETGGVQLCDFGVAGMMEHSFDKRSTFIGTPNWMAPEMFGRNPRYGKEVDIWAFGSMAYEMATGMPPNAMSGVTGPEMGNYLKQHIPRLDGDHYSDGMKDIVAYCLEERPEDRPTIEEVQNHFFIRDTEIEYPFSLLSELIKAFKHWEAAGGSRKSLFNPGGAQAPFGSPFPDESEGDWNFSTTAAFDQAVDDSTNFQDVINVYGSSVDLSSQFADQTSKPSRQQQARERGRRRPPPEALNPIMAPLEKLFDPNTISNYEENSRVHYGRDFVMPMSDLPLRERDDTAKISIRDTMIDLGGHDSETGDSSFPGMTLRADRSSRTDASDYAYNDGTFREFSAVDLSDIADNNNRRTQEWKFPSVLPASADTQTSHFPTVSAVARPPATLGVGSRPTLVHHPTEPIGIGFSNSMASVPNSPRMSVRESLIDLDFSMPESVLDYAPEHPRPSTADSTASGDMTSENPFNLERHASSINYGAPREPSLYIQKNPSLSTHFRSTSHFQDLANESDFSAASSDAEQYGNSSDLFGHHRAEPSSDLSDFEYAYPQKPINNDSQSKNVVLEKADVERQSLGRSRFPPLINPPSIAVLSDETDDRETAQELRRIINGFSDQLAATKDVLGLILPGQNGRGDKGRTDE